MNAGVHAKMSQTGIAGGFASDRVAAARELVWSLCAERPHALAWSRAATLAAAGGLTIFAMLAVGCWYGAGAVVPWDSKNHFYPMVRHLADGLARGEIPYWNPFHFGGHPAIADPQSLIFTPTMFLFAWLAPGASMQLFDAAIFAHLLMGGLAILGLFRRRDWHPAGAVLAGMIFILGGPAASRLQHNGIIISYAYLPLAILVLEIALERASLRWAALFGMVAACMAIGRDQVAFLGCLVLLLVVALEAVRSGAPLVWLGRRWAVLGLAGLVGLSLLAIPSLLTMQFLADSNRPGISYGIAVAGSLAPVNLATMLAPNVFGSLNWTYDYWGPGYETTVSPDHTDRAINYLFFGSLPALLLLWHGVAGRRLLGRSVRGFLIVSVAALLYAIGRSTPFFSAVFDALPGVQLYRRPADATFLLNFAWAVCAGYLLHRYIAEGLPNPFRELPKAAATALAFAAVALAAALVGGALAFSSAQQHFDFALREIAVAGAIFAGLAIVMTVFDGPGRRAAVAVLLVAVTGGELLARNAAASINAEPAARYVFDSMPAAQAAGLEVLRKEIAAKNAAGAYPRVEVLGLPGGWQNASMVFGLENTLGYNPLRIAAYARAVGPGENAVDPNSRKFPGTFRGYTCTLASLLGLEYLVLDRPLARLPRHVPRPFASQVYAADGMYVYRLRNAAPRAYLATGVKPVDTDDALANRSVPEFDRSREALIDETSMAQIQGVYAEAAGETNDASVKIMRHGANRVELAVDTARAGIVVLHDLYYPGWTVKVDGMERPVLRANMLFRGVEVGAGHHVVTFEFDPLSYANLSAALKGALRLSGE